jgi:hypothetical protein
MQKTILKHETLLDEIENLNIQYNNQLYLRNIYNKINQNTAEILEVLQDYETDPQIFYEIREKLNYTPLIHISDLRTFKDYSYIEERLQDEFIKIENICYESGETLETYITPISFQIWLISEINKIIETEIQFYNQHENSINFIIPDIYKFIAETQLYFNDNFKTTTEAINQILYQIEDNEIFISDLQNFIRDNSYIIETQE